MPQTTIFCDYFNTENMPRCPARFTQALTENDQVVTYFLWVLYIGQKKVYTFCLAYGIYVRVIGKLN